MGKKPQRHSWPEAKKLCRLNQNDIEMAKRLGFGPDALIRSRPDPKQRWKLPVKYWIRELHFKRFGEVLGEPPLPGPAPVELQYDEEAAREYGEQLYWEDYRDRNREDDRSAKGSQLRTKPSEDARGAGTPAQPRFSEDDVPF